MKHCNKNMLEFSTGISGKKSVKVGTFDPATDKMLLDTKRRFKFPGTQSDYQRLTYLSTFLTSLYGILIL